LISILLLYSNIATYSIAIFILNLIFLNKLVWCPFFYTLTPKHQWQPKQLFAVLGRVLQLQ
jgi:hypothetical protein